MHILVANAYTHLVYKCSVWYVEKPEGFPCFAAKLICIGVRIRALVSGLVNKEHHGGGCSLQNDFLQATLMPVCFLLQKF